MDLKLRVLAGMVEDHPSVTVTYFQSNDKKSGGAYVTATGAVKKVDEYEHAIVLMDRRKIAL